MDVDADAGDGDGYADGNGDASKAIHSCSWHWNVQLPFTMSCYVIYIRMHV